MTKPTQTMAESVIHIIRLLLAKEKLRESDRLRREAQEEMRELGVEEGEE